MQTGTILQQLRTAKGLSKNATYMKSGVSDSIILSIENGGSASFRNVYRLAKVYETSLNNLAEKITGETLNLFQAGEGQTLFEIIRNARLAAGLSGAELARQSGVGITTLSSIETGKSKNPTFEHMAKLAAVLGLSLDEIAERVYP